MMNSKIIEKSKEWILPVIVFIGLVAVGYACSQINAGNPQTKSMRMRYLLNMHFAP